ncbi:MAG: transposase [Pseudomonadota bacterium]
MAETLEYSFLGKCHSQALQAPIHALDRAFKEAFDKTQPNKRIPRFKKKGQCTPSIRYPQGFKIDEVNSKIFLPKIGWVKYRNSRKIQGVAKNVTVSKKGKYWFVSVQTEYEVPIQGHKANTAVGIDMGVKRFATLSNGTVYAPLNSLKRWSPQLAKLQKQLKNKVKFSNNWKKQQVKIGSLHQRISNARQDYIHKASTEISKNHALLVIEDLRIKNMTTSAKGTLSHPGKNVGQKSGLNRSILDQGWGMFFSQLEYKQQWAGGWVLRVNPARTSQGCPACKHISALNRQTQEVFLCAGCGFTANADDVASMNILERGMQGVDSAFAPWETMPRLVCEVSRARMRPAAENCGA